MSSHLATERLSAYLDDELDGADVRLVEEHVLECSQCQHRLSGLRRVVDELRHMPAASPPPLLGRRVENDASARWRARREEARRGRIGSGGFEQVQGPIRLGFAVIAGLAIMAVLFAQALERQQAATRLVVPPAAEADRAAERVEAGGRVFVLARGSWWQEDLLGGGRAEEVSAAGAMSAEAALESASWLAPLLARAPVVVELDGAVVVVSALDDRAAPGAPRPPAASQGKPAPKG